MSPTPFRHVRVRAWPVISICMVLMAVVPMWTRQQRAATAFTVNSLVDMTNASDGLCRLREAITAANRHAVS